MLPSYAGCFTLFDLAWGLPFMTLWSWTKLGPFPPNDIPLMMRDSSGRATVMWLWISL